MPGILPIPPREIARRAALCLDCDGTLVEIAPRPEAIAVPACLAGLLGDLARASAKAGRSRR